MHCLPDSARPKAASKISQGQQVTRAIIADGAAALGFAGPQIVLD